MMLRGLHACLGGGLRDKNRNRGSPVDLNLVPPTCQPSLLTTMGYPAMLILNLLSLLLAHTISDAPKADYTHALGAW